MNPPTSLKEVRHFMGALDCYRGMWERHLHTLAPLTNIKFSKVKFKWTKIKQDAFDEIKHIVACNTLLAYLGFNEEFKIHTDANVFQLGAVIMHKGKLVTFYSKKINDSQKRYTVT